MYEFVRAKSADKTAMQFYALTVNVTVSLIMCSNRNLSLSEIKTGT